MATTTWTQTAGMTSDEDVDNVDSFAEQAEASKDAAAASATAAAASESAASASASSASASATTATTKAAEASTSATNAATSASSASSSATSATASETAAATSKNAAAASATAAAASETAAAASETAAASSETNAATSETNAATSATSASTSATTASTAATTASTAATNAATSETNAATSASTASTAATNAATSETNAATSETNAATSATNAATSETNAATSATSASTSASAASTSATAAAASQSAAAASAASAASAYDTFDDRYLGSKTADPTVDNDGDALVAGALYFNSTANEMRVYDGANWIAATSAGNVSLLEYKYTATSGQTTFSGADDSSNTLSYTQDNLIVTLNGVVLENGTDYTATTGTSVVLASGAATSDELNVIAFKSFTTADMVSSANGGTFYNNIDVQGTVTADGLTVGDGHTFGGDAFDNLVIETSTGENAFVKTDNTFRVQDQNGNDRLRITASTGDISFYEDTGTTAKFFWDASQESLAVGAGSLNLSGVGTNSQNSIITLQGTNQFRGILELASQTGVSSSGSPAGEIRIFDAGNLVGKIAGLGTDLTNHDDGDLQFSTTSGGTLSERMRIDSSGNVGIGTVPDTDWYSGVTALQIDDAGSISQNGAPNGRLAIALNAKQTGSSYLTGWEYQTTDEATQYLQIDGSHIWKNAASGTADTAITWSESMRIDSSGNLLVGTTQVRLTEFGQTDVGINLLGQSGQEGQIQAQTSGTPVALFSRRTSDGDIVQFRKDGSTVGSIGAKSGDLYIGEGDTGLKFDAEFDAIVPFNTSTLANRDAAVDLGYSNPRFKDLYLSGGVYLGGTVAANHLDDYEEGTFTPSLNFGGGTTGISYNTRSARYIRIGDFVHVWIYILLSNKGSSSGHATISGLPFAAEISGGNVFSPIGDRGRLNTGGRPVSAYINHAANYLPLYSGGFDGSVNSQVNNTHFNNNTEIDITLSYPAP